MVISVVLLVGNFLVILVVVYNKRLWIIINFYIVNLVVVDLLVMFFCYWVGIVVDLIDGWIFGVFFCKFNVFV